MDECLFRSKDELNNPLLIPVKEEQNEKKWSKMHCVAGIASGAIVKRTHVAKANVNNTHHFFHPTHPRPSFYIRVLFIF